MASASTADATRIHLLRAVRDAAGHEHGLTLARDVHHLETAIDRCDADLVVIDPISAYLGEKDAYKDAEVRALLAPLVTLAERTRVAVVAIAHLTKDSQRRAIHRALNSVAFVAAARIVLAVGLDPDDDASDADTKRRVFLHVKNNLTHAPPALAFRTTPTFAWEPGTLTGLNADAVLGAPLTTGEEREEGLDADALLRELLALGERPASEIFQAAKANGIAERTLYRAKRRLGIKTRHEGQPGKKGGSWHWSFPVSPTSNV